MHDYLFEHQQQEGNDLLTLVDAAGFGLDASRFERDVVLHHYLQHVQEDFKSGVMKKSKHEEYYKTQDDCYWHYRLSRTSGC